MIEHFKKESLPRLSEKKPLCLFFCEPGGMGCPGLIMGIWPDRKCCVANLVRCVENPEYGEFFDEVISYIPEFPSVLAFRGPIKKKRNRYDPNNADIVYLGAGNHAVVYPEFKCMVPDWQKYRGIMDYVKSFLNTNGVDLYEESMRGNY